MTIHFVETGLQQQGVFVMSTFNVSVVGGAASESDLAFANALGAKLAEAGYILITGGMGGVMEAASKGAFQSGGQVVGILPGNDPKQGNTFLTVALPTGFGAGRNVVVAQSDVVIAIGGQAGTLSEMALAWKFNRLVLAKRGDGWAGRLADEPLDDRIRYPDMHDDKVFGFDTVDEALAILSNRLEQYSKRTTGTGQPNA